MPNNEDILKKAITKVKKIEFLYKGHKRIADPHHYGLHGGEKQLHAYQTGGASSSGGLPEWRNFSLSEIENLKILETSFTPPSEENYNPNHPHYTDIEAQVEMPSPPRPKPR